MKQGPHAVGRHPRSRSLVGCPSQLCSLKSHTADPVSILYAASRPAMCTIAQWGGWGVFIACKYNMSNISHIPKIKFLNFNSCPWFPGSCVISVYVIKM